MFKTIIVGRARLMCEVMASVLSNEDAIDVLGSVTTAAEAVSMAVDADMALVSATMPERETLSLITQLTEMHPPVKVIVVGALNHTPMIIKYLEAGAAGYVLDEESVDGLVRAIRLAADGHAELSPELAGALMKRIAQLADHRRTALNISLTSDLTPREREILALLAENYSNKEIANQLFIETGTVKNHVHNILNKLNVKSRHEAALYVDL